MASVPGAPTGFSHSMIGKAKEAFLRSPFTVPWLIWRLGRTDHWAPLVVVQIITGILLGPGVLGQAMGFTTSATESAPKEQ